MSRRNLRKLQAQHSQPQPSNSEEDDLPPQHFVVKKNTFSFDQSDDSRDSDHEEESQGKAEEAEGTEEQMKDGGEKKREEGKKEEQKKDSEDLADILEEFGVQDTPQPDTLEERYESVLKKQAKHFNSEWEINKKFRTSTVQSRTHATRSMRRTILTPTVLNWPASIEYALDMELKEPG